MVGGLSRVEFEEQRIPGMVSDVMLEVRLKLKTDGGRAAVVNGKVRLVHYERLAQDRFHVGVEFTGIDTAQQRKLEDFINDRIQEAETTPAE